MEKIHCVDSVKKRGITKSQVVKKRPTFNRTREESMDCSYFRRNCLLKRVIEEKIYGTGIN